MCLSGKPGGVSWRAPREPPSMQSVSAPCASLVDRIHALYLWDDGSRMHWDVGATAATATGLFVSSLTLTTVRRDTRAAAA